MATTTPNFGWPVPTSTDLVKDGATAMEALGDAIDTSMVDLKGGTTGQVLSKASSADMDFSWVTDATGIPATIFDAKGDIIAATAADTASRLAVGANNTVLTADSSTATGLKWATPAGGGKVLQVVQDTLTGTFTTTSSTFADVGLTVSITPTSASSKVLVVVGMPNLYSSNGSGSVHNYSDAQLLRGTDRLQATSFGWYNAAASSGAVDFYTSLAYSYLDSPATTSATTYKVQMRIGSATSATLFANGTCVANIVVMEIGA